MNSSYLLASSVKAFASRQISHSIRPMVSDYLDEHGVSHSHGKRMFKKHNGVNIKKLIDEVISGYIASSNDKSLAQTAADLGMDMVTVCRLRKKQGMGKKEKVNEIDYQSSCGHGFDISRYGVSTYHLDQVMRGCYDSLGNGNFISTMGGK